MEGTDKVEEKKPIGWVDDSQINAWKAQHKCKSIPQVITPEDDETDHVTYFKTAGIDELILLGDYTKKGQEIKGLKVLFNTLRIGGSQDVVDYAELNKSAIMAFSGILKGSQSKLGKR
jgi:hypothetical protein